MRRLALPHAPFLAAWCAALAPALPALAPAQLAAALADLGALGHVPPDAWLAAYYSAAAAAAPAASTAQLADMLAGAAALRLQPPEEWMAGVCAALRAATDAEEAARAAAPAAKAKPRRWRPPPPPLAPLCSAAASLGAVGFLPDGDWMEWHAARLRAAMAADALPPSLLAAALAGAVGLEAPPPPPWLADYCASLHRQRAAARAPALQRCVCALLAACVAGRAAAGGAAAAAAAPFWPDPALARDLQAAGAATLSSLPPEPLVAQAEGFAGLAAGCGSAAAAAVHPEWRAAAALATQRALPALSPDQLRRLLAALRTLASPMPPGWIAAAAAECSGRLRGGGDGAEQRSQLLDAARSLLAVASLSLGRAAPADALGAAAAAQLAELRARAQGVP
jgi:hypothetical protein